MLLVLNKIVEANPSQISEADVAEPWCVRTGRRMLEPLPYQADMDKAH
ncbi:hypothetical protein ANO14919_020180 [Xylariales sp. No.14919]|nr:hypothetical protein ANO14919_020180 [Xylariales sp. No.14919]